MGKRANTIAHKETEFTVFPREQVGFNKDPLPHMISLSSKRYQFPISASGITGSVVGLVSLFEWFVRGGNFVIHRSWSKYRPALALASFLLLPSAPCPHLDENTLHINKLLSKTPQPWHFFLPFPNLLPFKTLSALPCSHVRPNYQNNN